MKAAALPVGSGTPASAEQLACVQMQTVTHTHTQTHTHTRGFYKLTNVRISA